MNTHPLIHTLLYGDPGIGKSMAAATWPKPMLVFCFDPIGKDQPYLEQGEPQGVFLGEDGTPWQHVVHPTNPEEILITLGYFFDLNPTRAEFRQQISAYERFQEYLVYTKYEDYATIVLDSLSGFRDAVVRLNQFKLNPSSKSGQQAHGLQWYGAAAQAIRNEVMATLCYVMTNVVVVAHVSKQKDDMRGYYVYGFGAPGQLSTDLAQTFSEVYYVYTKRGGDGRHQVFFQTEASEEYLAQTHIHAPNPCAPTYEALWR